ncbi:hypothetical protein SAMN06265350_10965 [Solitalea koreensis]|uniref:Uncharacterized protein n=1 Tax=Solitalea koreensis TaxID=543615 RepID=A0A521DY68_9SPHI|nr:hypothetical protein SAMN06265350_10965 [Solitalea koreensis]
MACLGWTGLHTEVFVQARCTVKNYITAQKLIALEIDKQ